MTSRLRSMYYRDGRERDGAYHPPWCVCVYVRAGGTRSVAAGLLGRSPVHAWEARVPPTRWCR